MLPGGGGAATLVIKVITDAKQAVGELDDAAGGIKGLERNLAGLALPAAAALGGIGALAVGAGRAASDVEQSFGALESVFGAQADAAKRLSESSAQAVGLSTADYAQMAAQLGAQLKNMGVAAEDILPLTEELIGQGADMAATFGGTTADAVASVSSLLRGERDPIEKYGVSIKDATVQAELAAQGLGDLEGEAKTAATTQATLALLTQQTADAQGAFARESDTAAGAQARASAEFENAAAALGEVLLPVMAALATILGDVAAFVRENSTAVQILVGIVAGLAAGILALNAAFTVYRAGQQLVQIATKAWTAVQWLLNAALNANPIGLVVLALAALGAALFLLWTKSETFRRIVTGVFEAVSDVVSGVVDFIVGLFGDLGEALAGPFEALVGIVESVFGTITGIVEDAVAFIEGIIGGISDAMAGVGEALDTINPFSAAPPPPGGGVVMRRGRGGLAVPVPGARGRRPIAVAITHRIEDPGGALARLPGGAAGVADLLNRGADASGLYRNLQHAAGLV